MYSYDEAKEATLKYFDGDELATSVSLDKYALRNDNDELIEKTPTDMHRRMAKEIARIEKTKFKEPMTEDEIFGYFDGFKKIIPQGSIMYGLGNLYKYITLSNCYVVQNPYDSYSSILKSDEEIVSISKRRGGCGIDISNLRPINTPTRNSAKYSTGIIPFMERYSNTIREVGQQNRRGALLISLSVHHPEILNFINAKKDKTRITGANISIKFTNEFLKAVEKDEEYEQRWPVDSENPIISKYVNAREIWNAFIKSNWDNAEPGAMLEDNIIENSPADCYGKEWKSISSNPCSELPLCPYDSCRLILLNLYSYIINPFKDTAKFDYDLFYYDTQIAQRLIDDIVDLELECIDRIIYKINNDPEPDNIKDRELNLWKQIREKCRQGRRTGTGITALGDCLASLNISYGSEKSIEVVDKIYKTLKFASYQSSIDMAKEIGSFEIWNKDLESECKFFQRFYNEELELSNNYVIYGRNIIEDMNEYGRRNIACLTTSPAGSVSLLTQTTSGIEPVFQLEYTRRKKISDINSTITPDFIDKSGDKWQNYKVLHPKLKDWMNITGETDINKSPWITADKINWQNRVKLQAAATSHIDHSISSCLASNKSLIQTSKGLFEIDEICQNNTKPKNFLELNHSLSSVNKDGNISQITSCYNNGLSRVVRLVLSGGNEFTATENHKVCVLSCDYKLEWKSIIDLTTEDIIVGRKGLKLYPDIRKTSLETLVGTKFIYDKRTNSKNITIPKKMTPDLARFLGYICSDGFVTINGIGLSQCKNNVCDDFIELATKLFNINHSILKDNRSKNLYKIDLNSRELSSFMKWIGITNHDEIKVPRAIRLANMACIKEFIKGVTLDGFVSKNTICIATSVSKKYLEQIKCLLLNMGISSNLLISNKPGYRKFPSGKTYKTQQSYDLLITNNREVIKYEVLIGFAEDRKNQELLDKYKRTARIKICGEIPDYNLREKFRKTILSNIKSDLLYKHFNSMCGKSRYGYKLNRESLIEMKDMGFVFPDFLIDETYEFYTIKHILYNSLFEQTFDLTVPNGNSYIANGIISHNTINLPNSATKEDVAMIYEEAWKSGVKGITIYREGSRDGILIKDKTQEIKNKNLEKTERPRELNCDVHHVLVNKLDYFVLVGLWLDGTPYEMFAGRNGCIGQRIKKGKIIRKRKDFYKFISEDGEYELAPITGVMTDIEETISRLTSGLLRSGADMNFIVTQLEKIGNGKTDEIHNFGKCLARCLRKEYIFDNTPYDEEKCPDCGGDLVRMGGCPTCSAGCGYSKCL